MTSLGFIPARGGSKGIPNKNLYPLAGKPMIAYTIEAALKSRLDRVIVSTDSPEIAKVAQQFGADVPFFRPTELAGDQSTIEEALRYTLNQIDSPDICVILQPTSPLRTSKSINDALDLIENQNFDSAFSVSEPLEHPADMVYFEDDKPQFLMKDKVKPGLTQRQAFPDYLFVNGAVYAFRTKLFLESGTRFVGRSAPVLMASELSLDIDSIAHLKLAEAYLNLENKV